jgi:hypothetical protein
MKGAAGGLAATVSRILKWLALAAFAIAASVLMLVSSNALGGNLLRSIAERIPFVSNFVVKTFPTYLYAATREDVGVLKVARYDIDFLASFTGVDGRYVALYPFTVEAEVDLDRLKDGRPLSVEYSASLDEKTAASMVFMNTLSLDYNSVLSPALAMYRERALDLAREDAAFVDDARTKAESYVTALFGDSPVEWAGDEATEATEASSRFVPVMFRSALDAGRTAIADGASLRDAFVARTKRFDSPADAAYRVGKAGTSLGTFDSFAREAVGTRTAGIPQPAGAIAFRYHDPAYAGDLTFTSRADEGYRTAFAYFRGSTDVYYVDAACDSEINDEARARNVAPALLFVAASLKPTGTRPALADAYDSYRASCESALGAIRGGLPARLRYGREFLRALEEMDRASFAAFGTASTDAAILRELSDVGTDDAKLLELVARSIAGDVSDGDAAGATGATGTAGAAGTTGANDANELSGNVAALLWTMRGELGLSAEEADGYRKDLLAKGAALSRELVASLSSEERNTLYAGYFARRLGSQAAVPTGTAAGTADGVPCTLSTYVGENGEAETWMYWGKAANEWKASSSQIKIAEKLEKSGMKRGGKFVLAYAERDEKAGMFTNYDALVLDGETVTHYRNFARWLRLSETGETAKFADVKIVDGSFAVGSRVVSGQPTLAAVMGEFAKAFQSDAYNRDRVAELLTKNLEREALRVVERPAFGR